MNRATKHKTAQNGMLLLWECGICFASMNK